MQGYMKAIVAGSIGLLVTLLQWYTTGVFNAGEVATGLAGLLTAAGVLVARNTATWTTAKALIGLAMPIVVLLVSGFTTGEFNKPELALGIEGLITFLAVYWTSNDPTPSATGGFRQAFYRDAPGNRTPRDLL